jgi:serine/threonine protein phosphatase 1
MRYVIGDIHGEFYKLRDLVNKILLNGCKKIIFVGDYIGKGLYSQEVIDYLINLSSKIDCVFLKGNHEVMLLRALVKDKEAQKFLEKYGDNETFHSYLKDNYTQNIEVNLSLLVEKMPVEHLNFIKNARSYYESDGYLIVHAGVNPENVIIADGCEDLFFIRYKFIDYNAQIINKRIIFGHTAFKTPYFDKYKVGIDTGAAYSEYGNLTAYNLEEGYAINHFGQIVVDPYFNSRR